MRIAVTGAAGFLGSHVAEVLSFKGHSVTGIDNLRGGDLDNVPRNCWFHRLDILHAPEQMHSAMRECDVVCHCAALAYEGLSVFSPGLIAENIVVGTVSVAVAAIRAGVKRFVNCSSMARYGDGHEPPFREDGKCRPVDPYGAAKLAAEAQLDILGAAHGMHVLHAVPHNIVGPRQRFDDPYRNVAAIMANRMLSGKRPVIYGDGEQMRCFSDVRDALPPLLRLIEDGASFASGEVFNIGPDEHPTSILKLAEMLGEILGTDDRPMFVADRPREVKAAWCSAGKARSCLGYETRHSLRETLESVVEWVKRAGPREFRYDLPIEIASSSLPLTWRDKLL